MPEATCARRVPIATPHTRPHPQLTERPPAVTLTLTLALSRWEKKGVPLRIECGPRDVEAGTLLCARRTGGDKFPLPLDDSFASTGRRCKPRQVEAL